MKIAMNLILLFALSISVRQIIMNGEDVVRFTSDLCSKSAYKDLRVKLIFRYDDYNMGLVSTLTTIDGKKKTAFIKLKYYSMTDPSGRQPHEYFSTAIWDSLKQIIQSKRYLYAFSARTVVLHPQLSSLVTFFVYQDQNNPKLKNFTEAHAFNLNSLEHDYLLGKEIYNPVTNTDNSGIFNLKLLFLHIPDGVDIKHIVILDLKSTSKDTGSYYALIYTSERYDNKDWYFRHHLFSTLVETDNYKLIEWRFDTRGRQCVQLDEMPDAVIEAKTDIIPSAFDEFSVQQNTKTTFKVKLIEFIQQNHRFVTLEFNDEHGFIQELDEDKDKLVNNLNMLYCDAHPEFEERPSVNCSDEHMGPKAIPDFDLVEHGSEDEQQSSTTFLIFGVILSLMGIIILIAFAIFMCVDSTANTK